MWGDAGKQLAVLFIHGTGTRPKNQSENLSRVREAFDRHALPGRLTSFYWGQHLGASLAFDGKSIPRFDETDDPDGIEDYDDPTGEGYWETLAGDPFHQLRTCLSEREVRGTLGDEARPGDLSIKRIKTYEPSPELLRTDIGDHIAEGVDHIRQSKTFERAAHRTQFGDLVQLFARAVVGFCLNELAVPDKSWPSLALREQYVRTIVIELDATTLGGPLQWIAAPFVSLKMRKRGKVTRSATPFIGDIMRFVRDPSPFRASLRACLDGLPETDVVLLGHSLGGVVAIDLVVNDPHPKVRGVVTMGSQSGLLREFDVIPVGNANIFDSIPWLNIYHGRDYLSYLAAPVFSEGMVEDYRIDDWQPFPSSHSSYLRADQDLMWRKVRELVDKAVP
ncbi:alpha/beta fold hydrolase [Nocardia amamiensis]|uniref:alpha/beta fold hydrolase n=1 Tax=Nocardia amamiensis TaxID=404578 RepID=UPI0012F4E784|nr:hypothetical protein [Nocardia amamiensis]